MQADLVDALTQLHGKETELEKSTAELTNKLKGLLSKQTQTERYIEECEQRVTELQNEIATLKKQKAGATRHTTIN